MKTKPPTLKKSSPFEAARAVLRMLESHLGSQAAEVDFARAFAGLKITFPAPEIVERLVNESRAVVALTADPSTTTVRRLAEHQHVPLRKVAKAFSSLTGTGLKALRAERAARGETSDSE